MYQGSMPMLSEAKTSYEEKKFDFETIYKERFQELERTNEKVIGPDDWDVSNSIRRFLENSPHIEQSKRKEMARWILDNRFIVPYGSFIGAETFAYDLMQKQKDIDNLKGQLEDYQLRYNKTKEFKELFLDEK